MYMHHIRYNDFIVNEISLDGTVVHLSSPPRPKKTGVGDIGSPSMTTQLRSHEIYVHLVAYVGVDIASKMMAYVRTPAPSFKVITDAVESKEKRSEIKAFIKIQLKDVFTTETTHSCIKIIKNTHAVRSKGIASIHMPT